MIKLVSLTTDGEFFPHRVIIDLGNGLSMSIERDGIAKKPVHGIVEFSSVSVKFLETTWVDNMWASLRDNRPCGAKTFDAADRTAEVAHQIPDCAIGEEKLIYPDDAQELGIIIQAALAGRLETKTLFVKK